MNKYTWIVSIFLLLLAGYVAAGPYITVSEIKSGIVDQDSERLSENIDFPSLRQNLKEQLNAMLMKDAVTELDDNPFGALAIGLASKFMDGMVDTFVTPSGLATMMQGNKPDQSSQGSDTSTQPKKEDLFKDATYSYDSLDKCSVWVHNEDGDKVRFVLKREGVSWKLVNIVLPIDESTT